MFPPTLSFMNFVMGFLIWLMGCLSNPCFPEGRARLILKSYIFFPDWLRTSLKSSWTLWTNPISHFYPFPLSLGTESQGGIVVEIYSAMKWDAPSKTSYTSYICDGFTIFYAVLGSCYDAYCMGCRHPSVICYCMGSENNIKFFNYMRWVVNVN